MQESSGEIALEKGRHRVVLTFFERGGAERLRVEYAGPGIKRQPIATSALSH